DITWALCHPCLYHLTPNRDAGMIRCQANLSLPISRSSAMMGAATLEEGTGTDMARTGITGRHTLRRSATSALVLMCVVVMLCPPPPAQGQSRLAGLLPRRAAVTATP